MPELPLYLRVVRQLLKRLNYVSPVDQSYKGPEPFDPRKIRAAEDGLRALAPTTAPATTSKSTSAALPGPSRWSRRRALPAACWN